MRQNHTILLYELVKGFEMNVERIIEESILDYVESKFSGNIPYPSLITYMCIKGGVKFNEEEERCPKASPLTLTGALKALVESEKGERRENTRKRKRANTKVHRELIPTAIAEEEASSEEGVFPRNKDHLLIYQFNP